VHLVVGLGNPGREHEGTRHNIGFRVVDWLKDAEGWPAYREKFQGLLTRGQMQEGGDRRDVSLLKPQTYMNLSGESVQPVAAFLKVPPERIVVIHDELDLPWREVRLKIGGGHAGHNGLRSIIENLGTPDFVRVRIGIAKPPAGVGGDGASKRRPGSSWVLSRFDAVECAELPDVLRAAERAVRLVCTVGPAGAMSAVNTRK
jgi:PTH1 family peptidyl-tRNA hydrolase